jgi:hypothetical protein
MVDESSPKVRDVRREVLKEHAQYSTTGFKILHSTPGD